MNNAKRRYIDRASIIAFLIFVLLAVFVIHVFLTYNLYYYGNMDYVLAYQDWNKPVDLNSLAAVNAWWYKYFQISEYIIIMITMVICLKKFGVQREYFILYLLIYLCMVINLARTTDPMSVIKRLGLFGDTLAPGTVFSMLLFFVAYNKDIWRKLFPHFKTIMILAVILTIWGLLNIPYSFSQDDTFLRYISFKWIKGPIGILALLYPLSFSIFKKYKKISVLFLTGLIIAGTTLLQTRMTLLILVLSLIIYYIMLNRSKVITLFGKKIKKTISILFILVFAFTLLMLIPGTDEFFNKIPGGRYVNIFMDRIYADTRSSQYVNNLPKMADDLLLGVGYIQNDSTLQIDNGYINTAYRVGFPMLMLFVLFAIVPLIRAFRMKNLSMNDIGIITIGLARALWLFSSATTTFSIDFVVLILCAGRCQYLVDQRHKKKSLINKKGYVKSYENFNTDVSI